MRRVLVPAALVALALLLYPLEALAQGSGGRDPARIFARFAKGRSSVPVSELQSGNAMQDALAQYAKDKGLSELTAENIAGFPEWRQNRKSQGSTEGDAGDPDKLKAKVERNFKQMDRNQDGYLDSSEIRPAFKDLMNYDRNGDGKISLEEFTAYMEARSQGRQQQEPANKKGTTTKVEPGREGERKITVYRAGKIPKEAEGLFKQLDTDGDGQISLYEWVQAKRPLEEFQEFDRNDDGFITVEEYLRHQRLTKAKTGSSSSGTQTARFTPPAPAAAQPQGFRGRFNQGATPGGNPSNGPPGMRRGRQGMRGPDN
jgi:Ca2+-binding EF-hand superfamily protein